VCALVAALSGSPELANPRRNYFVKSANIFPFLQAA
jgi:hypothetical protein